MYSKVTGSLVGGGGEGGTTTPQHKEKTTELSS